MKKLLIVVDMLNAFCYVNGSLAKSHITDEYYASAILGPVGHMVDDYRNAKDPIIWLCDAHAKDDKEFDRFPPHAIKGTWDAEIIGELFPKVIEQSPHEMVIPKTRYSGFYGTDLEYQLMRIAPNEVTVVGVCTSICCLMTITGLANRDQNIIAPKDAMADFDPAAHDFALEYMKNILGVKIV